MGRSPVTPLFFLVWAGGMWAVATAVRTTLACFISLWMARTWTPQTPAQAEELQLLVTFHSVQTVQPGIHILCPSLKITSLHRLTKNLSYHSTCPVFKATDPVPVKDTDRSNVPTCWCSLVMRMSVVTSTVLSVFPISVYWRFATSLRGSFC